MTPSSVVYFIRRESDGHIKIGHTTDLPGRLSTIRSAAGTPLEILATEPGSLQRERQLQRRFLALHAHGEWFLPGAALCDYIAELRIAQAVDAERHRGPAFVSAAEAARRLGISKPQVYALVARGEIPSVRWGHRMVIPAKWIDDEAQRVIDEWRARAEAAGVAS